MPNRFSWPLLAGVLLASPVHAKVYNAIKGESKLTYHLVHKMHEVVGVSSDFRCAVDLPADTLKTRVFVKAPVSGFNSGNSNRDATVLEVLDAAKHPYVEFAGDSVRPEDGPAGLKQWRVFGRLNFHGVKRPLNFLVTPELSPEKVRIRGKFTVLLSDHKVERPRLMMIPVEDALEIEIDVSAKRE